MESSCRSSHCLYGKTLQGLPIQASAWTTGIDLMWWETIGEVNILCVCVCVCVELDVNIAPLCLGQRPRIMTK